MQSCQLQEAHTFHKASGAQHCKTIHNTSPKGQSISSRSALYIAQCVMRQHACKLFFLLGSSLPKTLFSKHCSPAPLFTSNFSLQLSCTAKWLPSFLLIHPTNTYISNSVFCFLALGNSVFFLSITDTIIFQPIAKREFLPMLYCVERKSCPCSSHVPVCILPRAA